LSWFAILFATILYKYLKKVEQRLVVQLYHPFVGDLNEDQHGLFSYPHTTLTLLTEEPKRESILGPILKKPNGFVRVMYSFVCMINYALSLLLMLVAMTYNSSLFLALCFGYGIGSFLFIPDAHHDSVVSNTEGDCH
jgi:hypothetical protein